MYDTHPIHKREIIENMMPPVCLAAVTCNLGKINLCAWLYDFCLEQVVRKTFDTPGVGKFIRGCVESCHEECKEVDGKNKLSPASWASKENTDFFLSVSLLLLFFHSLFFFHFPFLSLSLCFSSFSPRFFSCLCSIFPTLFILFFSSTFPFSLSLFLFFFSTILFLPVFHLPNPISFSLFPIFVLLCVFHSLTSFSLSLFFSQSLSFVPSSSFFLPFLFPLFFSCVLSHLPVSLSNDLIWFIFPTGIANCISCCQQDLCNVGNAGVKTSHSITSVATSLCLTCFYVLKLLYPWVHFRVHF